MVTVRAHVFDALPADPTREGVVIREPVEVAADPDYEVLEVVPTVVEGKPINESEVLVAGGRGIKCEEDIGMLRELAELLGGDIAARVRSVITAGWITACRSARAARRSSPSLFSTWVFPAPFSTWSVCRRRAPLHRSIPMIAQRS